MNFRTKIKREIASQFCDIQTETKEEAMEKHELGLRLLQFFEYENDPEFIKLFNKFCYKKKWEKIREEEKKER